MQPKQNWEWIDCQFAIKQKTDQHDIYRNLGSNVTLHFNDQEVRSSLLIQIDKPFLWTKQGWVWHKSWNIPIVKVIFQVPSKDNQMLTCSNQIYVTIQAVKPILQGSKRFHFLDIGIQGQNTCSLDKNYQCIFSQLKFTSTSFNHNESKFHLVVSVYIKDELKNNDVLIQSKISPPILIDSRRLARDTEKTKECQISFISDFFDHNLFEKKFMKKETKGSKFMHEEILNDFDGLFNYITAANIREKVRNPIFLSIYFSNCLELYYDARKFDLSDLQTFIIKVHQELSKSYKSRSQEYNPKSHEYPTKIILAFKLLKKEDLIRAQKIVQSFDIIRNGVLSIVAEKSNFDSNFVPISDTNQLREEYIKLVQDKSNSFDINFVESKSYSPTLNDGSSEINDNITSYSTKMSSVIQIQPGHNRNEELPLKKFVKVDTTQVQTPFINQSQFNNSSIKSSFNYINNIENNGNPYLNISINKNNTTNDENTIDNQNIKKNNINNNNVNFNYINGNNYLKGQNLSIIQIQNNDQMYNQLQNYSILQQQIMNIQQQHILNQFINNITSQNKNNNFNNNNSIINNSNLQINQ